MPDSSGDSNELPVILAGPILRRASPDRLVIWLVTSQPLRPGLALYPDDAGAADAQPDIVIKPHDRPDRLPIGTHAFVHCMDIALGEGTAHSRLPENRPVGYDILLFDDGMNPVSHDATPALAYPGEARPRFVVRRRITGLLHGSCRRPHHDSADGMARADSWLAARRDRVEEWPSVLILSGDQIYTDDVAGPMLRAIHVLIDRLGLHGEIIRGAEVDDDRALFADERSFYRRDALLPHIDQNVTLQDRFFGGAAKPVFTAASARNHLITLSEILAMYLLAWSDACWPLVNMDPPPLGAEYRAIYDDEVVPIRAFARQLPKTRRLLASIPTAMIFDDHDITDDWNLTAEWETVAYDHPFSHRIIGNGLIAYFVCQGWGNTPEAFRDTVLPRAETFFSAPDCDSHDQLVDTLLDFERWHYTLPTEPALVVLDTRTRRWRSERRRTRPSGLMDWEALTEMQQELLQRQSVILVSPAPIFGVKLIENIQRVFTWIGKPLLVDAENWMGHPGAAHVLLNIFRHPKTPANFTVLSGDVHYSFAYDVRLRHGVRSRPRIWQITSSGIKNEFPEQLLNWFDRLNRWLFAPYSPLNWFTKRRRMRIMPRKPNPSSRGERLVNGAGIGYIRFDDDGRPTEIKQLGTNGEDVVFLPDHARE